MEEINNDPKNENSIGPLIGSVIIVAIIALGGLYFWANQLNKKELQKQNNITNATSTDDLKSIEADLKKKI